MSKIPPAPPAAKAMFQNLGKAAKANTAGPSGRTDVGGSYHIPVHNSGSRRPNFPTGGGV